MIFTFFSCVKHEEPPVKFYKIIGKDIINDTIVNGGSVSFKVDLPKEWQLFDYGPTPFRIDTVDLTPAYGISEKDFLVNGCRNDIRFILPGYKSMYWYQSFCESSGQDTVFFELKPLVSLKVKINFENAASTMIFKTLISDQDPPKPQLNEWLIDEFKMGTMHVDSFTNAVFDIGIIQNETVRLYFSYHIVNKTYTYESEIVTSELEQYEIEIDIDK